MRKSRGAAVKAPKTKVVKDFWHGYEDNEKVFHASKKEMQSLSTAEREQLVEDAFQFYRQRNILPVRRLTQAGIEHEIEACLKKEVANFDRHLNEKSPAGTTLCKHFCDNFWTSTQAGNKSVIQSFEDDKILRRTLEWIVRSNLPPTPANLYSHVRLVGGNIPSVFTPMRSKAIYEKWVPKGGVIFDYAIGWGSRMLGALTSQNDYHYIGVDPNTETFMNVQKMLNEIERVSGKWGRANLRCVGSEIYKLEPESVDFAFSSPPYFDLEIYSEEPTQSVKKFPQFDQWVEYFVRPTIENCYVGLKPNCYLVINVKDFGKIKLEEAWRQVALDCGFVEEETAFIQMTVRCGVGREKTPINPNYGEPLLVFKKI
jgi:hypothetical protein